MVDAGEANEIVNSGGVTIENVTDSLTFKQLLNVRLHAEVPTTERQHTDDVLELQYDLPRFAIEGDIALTEPEVVTWAALAVLSNGRLPEKTWRITYTDEQSNATTLSGTMVLNKLDAIDPGVGDTNHHVRLQSTDGVLTAA